MKLEFVLSILISSSKSKCTSIRIITQNFTMPGLRLVVTALFLVISLTQSVSQDVGNFNPDQLPKYYIVGNKVNVRQEPNLKSKITYQSNWGEAYKGIKENVNWIKVVSADESTFYFVHSSFIVQEDEFLELAKSQKEKTGNTYFEMINIIKQGSDKEALEKVLLETLKSQIEPEIFAGFEQCLNVKYFAYTKLVELYEDDPIKMKSVDKISQYPKLKIWLKLDQIRYLLRNNDWNKSREIINELLGLRVEDFYLVNCDYDWSYRSQPLTNLKNYYAAIYHLGNTNEQLSSRNKLDQLRNSTKFNQMRGVIDEIIQKL